MVFPGTAVPLEDWASIIFNKKGIIKVTEYRRIYQSILTEASPWFGAHLPGEFLAQSAALGFSVIVTSVPTGRGHVH